MHASPFGMGYAVDTPSYPPPRRHERTNDGTGRLLNPLGYEHDRQRFLAAYSTWWEEKLSQSLPHQERKRIIGLARPQYSYFLFTNIRTQQR